MSCLLRRSRCRATWSSCSPEVGRGLGAEPLPVRARRDAGEVDDAGFAELVREVGVDDAPLGLLHEPHQPAEPAARELQHRQGDVDPPLVAGDVVEQHAACAATDGMAVWPSSAAAMAWTCLADPLGSDGVALELGELAAQHEQVEPLGVLVVVALRRRQAGQARGDLARRPRGSACATRPSSA